MTLNLDFKVTGLLLMSLTYCVRSWCAICLRYLVFLSDVLVCSLWIGNNLLLIEINANWHIGEKWSSWWLLSYVTRCSCGDCRRHEMDYSCCCCYHDEPFRQCLGEKEGRFIKEQAPPVIECSWQPFHWFCGHLVEADCHGAPLLMCRVFIGLPVDSSLYVCDEGATQPCWLTRTVRMYMNWCTRLIAAWLRLLASFWMQNCLHMTSMKPRRICGHRRERNVARTRRGFAIWFCFLLKARYTWAVLWIYI